MKPISNINQLGKSRIIASSNNIFNIESQRDINHYEASNIAEFLLIKINF